MTNNLSQEEISALGTGIAVDSFETLWRAVGRLPFVSKDGPYAWRGVPDSSFKVQSSLYRATLSKLKDSQPTESILREAEMELLADAREWGLGRIGTTQIGNLQLLANLQHHGLATRLLDVTANPLTALWFACAQYPDSDGLLLAFNLAGYKTIEAEESRITYGSLKDPLGWWLEYALEQSAQEEAPFVVRSTFLDARMAAQEGFFLGSACPPQPVFEYREVPKPEVNGMYLGQSGYIPGSMAEHMLFDDTPEFVRYPQAMWSFLISSEIKKDILPVLESNFNRGAAALFPDVAGFRDWH